jgi:nicotinamidase-related amidase
MKNETVLLITSAQNDLLDSSGKAWELVRSTVEQNRVPEKLSRLVEHARKVGMPVLFSPIELDYGAMAKIEPLTAIRSLIVKSQLLARSTPGVQRISRISAHPGDIVLRPRQGFSSFWARTIQDDLARLGARTIIIAGMLAEACVASHARDAAENGYRPVVVRDAIGSSSPEILEASLKTLALHTHALVTCQDVCAGQI